MQAKVVEHMVTSGVASGHHLRDRDDSIEPPGSA